MRVDGDRDAAARQEELRAIERKAQRAAEVPALNAALAAHVDSATIVDLLDNEDWWRRFRADFTLVRLIVGDAALATRGTADGPGVEADVVKAARRQTVASAQVTIGTQPYLLGAARLTEAPDGDPVLVLGRATTPIAAASRARAAARADPAPAAGPPPARIALVGFGLLFSRRGKAARAGAATTEPSVVPIVHETTLKFGEPREPRNDVHPRRCRRRAGAALAARRPRRS